MNYPGPLQKLIEVFTKFPGIGPRQAARFAFYILKNPGTASDLINSLGDVTQKIGFCVLCYRTLEKNTGKDLCAFCRDDKRENYIIAVVEKEADLVNLEKTNLFRGLYHVLNGLIAPLDPNSPKGLHLKELHDRIKSMLEEKGKCEIILATNATTEGDMTALYIERILEPLKRVFPGLKVSRLGRGLSLGSELEYADEVTLKNALTNRK